MSIYFPNFKMVRHPMDYAFEWSFSTTPITRFGSDRRDWKGFYWGYWGFYFPVRVKKHG